jgi:Ca2+-transporting ATPase
MSFKQPTSREQIQYFRRHYPNRNWFFIGINITLIIVKVGSSALSTVALDATEWGISLLLGAFSLPIGVLIRLTPNYFIR